MKLKTWWKQKTLYTVPNRTYKIMDCAGGILLMDRFSFLMVSSQFLFLHFVTPTWGIKTLTANCELLLYFVYMELFRFYYCVYTSIFSKLISFKKIVYIKYLCIWGYFLLFLLICCCCFCCCCYCYCYIVVDVKILYLQKLQLFLLIE